MGEKTQDDGEQGVKTQDQAREQGQRTWVWEIIMSAITQRLPEPPINVPRPARQGRILLGPLADDVATFTRRPELYPCGHSPLRQINAQVRAGEHPRCRELSKIINHLDRTRFSRVKVGVGQGEEAFGHGRDRGQGFSRELHRGAHTRQSVEIECLGQVRDNEAGTPVMAGHLQGHEHEEKCRELHEQSHRPVHKPILEV